MFVKAVHFQAVRNAVRAVPAPSASAVSYYHLDALGSVRAVTDGSGAVVRLHDYLPFGEEYQGIAGGDARRFTGKERDAETGLDYFSARYYAQARGRFTAADDPGYMDPYQPQSLNRYAYTVNNPLGYLDPDGHQPIRMTIYGHAPDEQRRLVEEARRNHEAAMRAWNDFLDAIRSKRLSDFSAGLGDALLLGTGPYMRRQLDIDVVDRCSSAYSAGGWSSFAFGAARVGYAGLVKGASMIARSGAEASAYRHTLRTGFRLGIGKDWRAPNLANKTDAQLRASAGRTNWRVNLYGAGVAAAGGAGGLGYGCGQ